MGKRRTPGHGAKTARHPTSLQFFDRLLWLDGRPLQIEEYRRRIFSQALDEVGPDGHPRYTMVVSGRGKKNNKTLDLVLAALYVLVIRKSVQGSDGLIAANDAGQALDDMGLARKLCDSTWEARRGALVARPGAFGKKSAGGGAGGRHVPRPIATPGERAADGLFVIHH